MENFNEETTYNIFDEASETEIYYQGTEPQDGDTVFLTNKPNQPAGDLSGGLNDNDEETKNPKPKPSSKDEKKEEPKPKPDKS